MLKVFKQYNIVIIESIYKNEKKKILNNKLGSNKIKLTCQIDSNSDKKLMKVGKKLITDS